MKLKHVAKVDFLQLLKAPKLEVFPEFVTNQNLFVHCSVLDPLYWSIVDIIDSILGKHGDTRLFSNERLNGLFE
ncbi:MAG: hypothetical protein COB46_01015 [Rhodospirillaceae bacterium]|nr:MAG: hypothetical protein COB46_01015 [Rhodospirillaceae bacterium]